MVHVSEYVTFCPRHTRSVPIAEWQSVRDMPVIVRALRRIKPEGTHKERSTKSQARRGTEVPTFCQLACKRTPMEEEME